MTDPLASNHQTPTFTLQRMMEYIRHCTEGHVDTQHAKRYFQTAIRKADPDVLADALALRLCGLEHHMLKRLMKELCTKGM